MIEVIVLISTILGGIAAIFFFWEKISSAQLLNRFRNKSAHPIPIDKRSVFAYVNGSERLSVLTQEIATRRGLELRNIDSQSIWLHEQIEKLEINTIRELDSYVKKYGAKAVLLSNYLTPKAEIDPGFVLGRVFHIIAIERGGHEGLREFLSNLKFSSGGRQVADEVYQSYVQIK